MIIAVYYDGTILQNGSIDRDMVNYLKEQQVKGVKVILWTARQGQGRDAAVVACEALGLVFDGVAEGKPLADLYIDDKAVKSSEIIRKKTRQRLTSLRDQRR